MALVSQGSSLRPLEAGPTLTDPRCALRFQRTRAFDLIRLGALDESHRELLGQLAQGPADDAVLLPRDPTAPHSAKVIGRGTADLLAHLAGPRPLIEAAGPEDLGEATRTAALLTLDGVLAVEHEGELLSGPAAHRALAEDPTERAPAGTLGRLAVAALRYAEALPVDDPRTLSYRLYGYNRVPYHPRWQGRFAGPDAVRAALGLGESDALSTLLARHYDEEAIRGWRSWSREGHALTRASASELTHKLYVSPHPESVTPAFRAAATLFAEHEVPAFKVGLDLGGLLRPDKIVAYFDSRAAMERSAAALAPRLAGLRAQGVPFTAEITPDGMLSWGSDPPVDETLIPWRGLESWRLWVTNQLASSLLLAREARAHRVEPWRFALDRLRLDGVDTESWTPRAAVSERRREDR